MAGQQHPYVLRAVEEWLMFTEAEVNRMLYNMRHKAQMELNILMRDEKYTMIHFCERLLNRPQTPRSQLRDLKSWELFDLTDNLQAQVLKALTPDIPCEVVPVPVPPQPQVPEGLQDWRESTPSDLKRERSEARRSAQWDYKAALREARLEGWSEGLVEGEKIGIIHLYERLLNLPQTPTDQLAVQTLEDLIYLTAGLQARFEKQT